MNDLVGPTKTNPIKPNFIRLRRIQSFAQGVKAKIHFFKFFKSLILLILWIYDFCNFARYWAFWL